MFHTLWSEELQSNANTTDEKRYAETIVVLTSKHTSSHVEAGGLTVTSLNAGCVL